MGASPKFPAFLLLLLTAQAYTAEPERTRVLPAGQLMSDSRTGKLRTLDDYAPFKPPASLSAWNKRRQELREQLLVANGLWPMPEPTPLRAVIHGKMDLGRYTVEKVSFASMPGVYVTGNSVNIVNSVFDNPVDTPYPNDTVALTTGTVTGLELADSDMIRWNTNLVGGGRDEGIRRCERTRDRGERIRLREWVDGRRRRALMRRRSKRVRRRL